MHSVLCVREAGSGAGVFSGEDCFVLLPTAAVGKGEIFSVRRNTLPAQSSTGLITRNGCPQRACQKKTWCTMAMEAVVFFCAIFLGSRPRAVGGIWSAADSRSDS